MEPTKNKLSLTIFLPSFLFYLTRLYRLRYPCSLNQRQTFAQRSSSRSLLNELVQHGTRLPPRYRDILEAEKWETKATSAITLPKIYLNRRSTVSTLASPYYQLANSSVISTGFSRVSSVANTAASSLSRKTIVSHQQGNPCCRNWWKIEHVSPRHYENPGFSTAVFTFIADCYDTFESWNLYLCDDQTIVDWLLFLIYDDWKDLKTQRNHSRMCITGVGIKWYGCNFCRRCND